MRHKILKTSQMTRNKIQVRQDQKMGKQDPKDTRIFTKNIKLLITQVKIYKRRKK